MRDARSRRTILMAAALVAALRAAAADPPNPAEPPKQSGLLESTATRLAQVDVSLTGPRDAIATLGKDDLSVKVNLRELQEFTLDVSCPEPEVALAPGAVPTPRRKAKPVSYILYFDMPYLKMAGRQRALDLAREILPRLLAGQSRAMVVSNARAMTTFASFTSDADALRGAIDRLEGDKDEWDQYAALETSRMSEVIAATEGRQGSIARGLGVARRFYYEDRFRVERDLRRLRMSLGQLAEVDPPKVVLYFADTMRDDPGRIYLDMFSSQTLDDDHFLPGDSHPLEAVIREAAALGIRFYTVQAEGLAAPSGEAGMSMGGIGVPNAAKTPEMAAVRSAQATLSALANETGGAAFLNGVPATKMTERIRADLLCIAIVSFAPGDLPQNTPLAVKIVSRRPEISARARGQMVIQSEDERRASKLFAAFVSPEAARNEMPIRAGVVPVGFADGMFSALLQVAVAGAPVEGAIWDIGASIVSRDKVRDEASGRITVKTPGTPVFFEKEVRFSPGPYEIVSVAHDATTGQVASRRDEGSWPDPDLADASVGPFAMLQPSAGAYLREGKAATSGVRAQSDRDPVRTDLPTAIVGIVCRGKKVKGRIRVDRRLEGETSVLFPEQEMDLGEERCAQIRDLIPAGSMSSDSNSPTSFKYVVTVSVQGSIVAQGERSFLAISPQ